MPKETITKPDKGGLIRMKFTFRYEGKFVEPDDDWLKCIEATSDELLGPYSKAEDTALSAAFGGRKKKRLSRVFDAIGFVYPDYRYPLRGQKRKGTVSMKEVASAAPNEPTPKRKKVKVVTHRPCYIEPAIVPKFVCEASSATEAKKPIPAQKTEELTATPKAERIEESKVEGTKISEILSPSAEVGVPQTQKGPVVTPKMKRMVNVLDVLETIKTSSSTPRKIAEAQKAQIETTASGAEDTKHQAEIKTGTSGSTKEKSLETEGETTKETLKQILSEKTLSSTPEASSKLPDYIVRHASGKMLSEEEKREAHHYAQKLKYPKGALIFNGSREEDFLYCLPDNKEISVCREMARSFRFPTLEDGLSVLSKDELADSLAYNNLKVRIPFFVCLKIRMLIF
jgi:hypothetical protein